MASVENHVFGKPLVAGKPLRRFTRNENIGGGSFGNVYRVTLEEKSYAMKKISITDKMEISFIMREIKALIALHDCENVVHYHQIWFTNKENVELEFGHEEYRVEGKQIIVAHERFTPKTIYIIMELCKTSLEAELLKGIGNDDGKKREIMLQILKGLCFVHQKDIVHRDLKPNNILIDFNNVVKISDFGLALIKNHFFSADETFVRGCKAFRPPEYGERDCIPVREVTDKVDVYSLGLIYYTMCCTSEITEDQLYKMAYCVTKSRLHKRYNQKISVFDWNLLGMMLTKDPKRRCTSTSIWKALNNRHIAFEPVMLSGYNSSGDSTVISKVKYGYYFESSNETSFNVTASIKEEVLLSARETLRGLEHKNIVKFLCTNEIGIKFFRLERLQKSLRQKIIDNEEIDRKHTQCSAEAVQFLHRMNIIHAALSPDNIFFTEEGTLKIGLFNFDLDATYKKHHFYMFEDGTINYIDACFVGDDGKLIRDAKLDVYSLGITFLEIFCRGRENVITSLFCYQYGKTDEEGKICDYNFSLHINSKIIHEVISEMIKVEPEERITIDEVVGRLSDGRLHRTQSRAKK